jgi:hypothetical protein
MGSRGRGPKVIGGPVHGEGSEGVGVGRLVEARETPPAARILDRGTIAAKGVQLEIHGVDGLGAAFGEEEEPVAEGVVVVGRC